MKLFKFTRQDDFGREYNVQLLFTGERAVFQGLVAWSDCASSPHLSLRIGGGCLLNVMLYLHRGEVLFSLFDRTWKLD